MTQVIIHENELGGVSVTIPTGEISIKDVQAKDTPDHSIIVNLEDLPNSDGDFFDAWTLVDGKVIVDLDKAKDVTKKRLRIEREPFMAAQDVLFQRALETGSDTKDIVTEKNRLRNITKLADAETTLEGLRAIKV